MDKWRFQYLKSPNINETSSRTHPGDGHENCGLDSKRLGKELPIQLNGGRIELMKVNRDRNSSRCDPSTHPGSNGLETEAHYFQRGKGGFLPSPLLPGDEWHSQRWGTLCARTGRHDRSGGRYHDGNRLSFAYTPQERWKRPVHRSNRNSKACGRYIWEP